MKSRIRIVLRAGNRSLRSLLPTRVHKRVEWIAKAVLRRKNPHVFLTPISNTDYRAFSSTEKKLGLNLIARSIHRDELAYPVDPFIGCNGRIIDSGDQFLEELEASDQTCDLVLCCAFTGRHRIIEKIIEESLQNRDTCNVRWMLAGSTPEDYAFIRTMSRTTESVAGFVVENRPLGRKWQTCVNFATRYYNADLFGITGSDDLVSQRLVEFIIKRHKNNKKQAINPAFLPGMYGTLEWLVCNNSKTDSLSPQVIKCSYAYKTAFEPLGAGRFYTQEFLKECNGLIFESNLEKLLDDRGYLEVRDRGKPLEYYTMEDGPLVSVKGDWAQLNSVAKFVTAETLDLEEYSFKGYQLLEQSLSQASLNFLFKQSIIAPQLSFSTSHLDLGGDRPDTP